MSTDLPTQIFLIITLLAFLVIMIAIILQMFANLIMSEYSTPFLTVPKDILEKALQNVKINENSNVIDLGSGIGTAVFKISKTTGADVTGIEFNFLLYLISQFRKSLLRENKTHFVHGNLLKHNLKEYDMIFFYLGREFLDKHLTKKLEKEVKQNAIVVSSVFKVESKEFLETYIETKGRFNQKGLYIYKKK